MDDESKINPADNALLALSLRSLVRQLLRPVARLLLKHGFSYNELVDLSKEAYVAAAARETQTPRSAVNISKVALRTGMSRRDVRKIAKGPNTKESTGKQRLNSATRVLSAWHQDTAYLDDEGQPAPLPASGPGSFETLANHYASDLPAGAIAAELKRVNAIAENEDGLLEVRSRFYMPTRDGNLNPDAIVRSGSVLEDLGTTIEHNLHRSELTASRFEGRVTNTRIPVSGIPEFRQLVEEQGQQFLELIDKWLSEHESSNEENTERVGLGLYWIQDNDTQDA